MVTKYYNRLRNFLKNIISNLKYFIKRKEYKKILSKNKVFKNSHIGERCFILGNGPSLKNVDFSKLTNEFTFSVNQLMRRDDFTSLNPNIHFWADENFFIGDSNKKEIEELITTMKKVYDTGAKVFYPISSMKFVNDNSLYFENRVFFHYSKLRMSDNYKGEIDFSKNTFGFGTVVQWCITLAIYMGFKEIYLLGCDNTAILACFNSFLQNDISENYTYSLSENERKRMANIVEISTMENTINAHLMTLYDYRALNNYCKRKGVKIINCSEKTLIDSLERGKLEDVLK